MAISPSVATGASKAALNRSSLGRIIFGKMHGSEIGKGRSKGEVLVKIGSRVWSGIGPELIGRISAVTKEIMRICWEDEIVNVGSEPFGSCKVGATRRFTAEVMSLRREYSEDSDGTRPLDGSRKSFRYAGDIEEILRQTPSFELGFQCYRANGHHTPSDDYFNGRVRMFRGEAGKAIRTSTATFLTKLLDQETSPEQRHIIQKDEK
jgi:hypothetical protein